MGFLFLLETLMMFILKLKIVFFRIAFDASSIPEEPCLGGINFCIFMNDDV